MKRLKTIGFFGSVLLLGLLFSYTPHAQSTAGQDRACSLHKLAIDDPDAPGESVLGSCTYYLKFCGEGEFDTTTDTCNSVSQPGGGSNACPEDIQADIRSWDTIRKGLEIDLTFSLDYVPGVHYDAFFQQNPASFSPGAGITVTTDESPISIGNHHDASGFVRDGSGTRIFEFIYLNATSNEIMRDCVDFAASIAGRR